jgi:hypothetical protein
MSRSLLFVAVLSTLASCTWVEPDARGKSIRVAYDNKVSHCRSVGTVTTGVKHKVGFYERNDIKVRDELESLARNEAANLGADTIVPLGEPVNGEQRFAAYVCGSAAPKPESGAKDAQQRGSDVEAFPIDG